MSGNIELVSGGTDNHLMLMDLKKLDISGKQLEVRLDSVRITANKNKVPLDLRGRMKPPEYVSVLLLPQGALRKRR